MRSTRWSGGVGLAGVWVCLSLVLVGCGDQASTPPEHEAELLSEVAPRSGGAVVVAVQDDAKSLDPHAVTDAASMRMIENVYATLLRYGDAYGDLQPDLAESVEVSGDGLRCTITLVDGATFHSGRPITSADVKYSIERIIEMKVRAQHFDEVESIETPDDRTAVLKLRQPVAPLKTYLAYPMNAIVDREVVEANDGRLDQADAGAGPFKLVHWKRDQEAALERFDGYHIEGRPLLDRVTYRPMPDETARSTAIRTGDVDLIVDVAAKDVRLLKGVPDVRMTSAPGTFWEYVGMNCQRAPLDDVRVRQAIAWAINRQQINALVKFGQATVLDGGHLPPNHWADAGLAVYPKRDLVKARALLAEAGHDHLSLTMKVGSAFPYQVKAAEVVKQQLGDAGINVQPEQLESAVFFDALGSHDFDLTLVGWVGFVDPDEWMWNLFHTEGKWNQQQYRNTALDALLERGRRTIERGKRVEIYKEAQRIIAEQAPMAFLYVNNQTSAWRNRVHGFVVHPTATTISLRDTFVAE